MIRLRSIRLSQNKFHLMQEEIGFLISECQTEWAYQAKYDFQMDQPTQLEISSIEQTNSHTQCLSNDLNDIYT